MKTIKYIIITITLGALLAIGYFFLNNESKVSYTLETYQTEDGWGYIILKNNKPVIKQYRIPAIQKKHAFPSERSARIVGEKVLKKINENKIPSIKPNELIKFGIIDSLHKPIP